MRAAICALTAGVLLATMAAMPAAAQPRTCGAISFSGTNTHIVVLRGVRCAVAKEIAKRFSITAGGPQGSTGWSCFLAHAPFRQIKGRDVGFTCKRGRAHVFVGTVGRAEAGGR
jgi:hypothetical protein